MTFLREVKFALRALARTKGLALTVVVTLALGIGANAAIFSLVRGVLLRPLANRDEDRLIYIRQSAPGLGMENAMFSVPEIQDLRSRVKSVSAFGDFSTIGFTMVGLGEPREVRSGVVGGSYFAVMGLNPVLGRLLGPATMGRMPPGRRADVPLLDDGAEERCFGGWQDRQAGDARGYDCGRAGTLGAISGGDRDHRQRGDEPASSLGDDGARPDPSDDGAVWPAGSRSDAGIGAGRFAGRACFDGAAASGGVLDESQRADQRGPAEGPDHVEGEDGAAGAAGSGRAGVSHFVLECRQPGAGAERAARRRTGGAGGAGRDGGGIAESAAGGKPGAMRGWGRGGRADREPMVSILARYASRFSVRALDLTVDASLLWAGAVLAVVAAVLLAFVPRLPSAGAPKDWKGQRQPANDIGSTNRRLRVFAVTQIAACFLLLVGATMLLKTLLALQAAETGFDTRHVLAVNVPVMSYGRTPEQVVSFYKETMRRITELPNVERVAFGTQVPWRDAGSFGPGFEFSVEGHVRAAGEDGPRARFRTVSPGFFGALGVPLIAGRDFNDLDRHGAEPVVIVSQSLAQRMFPNQDAVNRHLLWTDAIMKFIDVSQQPRRIVGVVADVDDENVAPGPALTVYHPLGQEQTWSGRVFVHAHGDPYALVSPIRRIIHDLSSDQPVERAATLEDIRAEVLTPDRLNTLVFGGFAAVALAIAVVGVAGVLAFSVSGRMREFGIRLAIGSEPRDLVAGVMSQGAVMAAEGVAAGGVFGLALARLAGSYFEVVRMPGVLPVAGSAAVLLVAAMVASLLPAARAARVDVVQALRAE